jgi:hypothetical protein
MPGTPQETQKVVLRSGQRPRTPATVSADASPAPAQPATKSLEQLALAFFTDFWLKKSARSESAVAELKAINDKLKVLGDLYPKLVALDNKIDDAAGANAVADVLNTVEKFGELDIKSVDAINASLVATNLAPDSRLFPTTATISIAGQQLSSGRWTLPIWQVVEGGLLPGKTTGADIHNAVIKLDSLMQQLATDNQFKSTQASTATQAAAGALEALKSLNDKFNNNLIRILSA